MRKGSQKLCNSHSALHRQFHGLYTCRCLLQKKHTRFIAFFYKRMSRICSSTTHIQREDQQKVLLTVSSPYEQH